VALNVWETGAVDAALRRRHPIGNDRTARDGRICGLDKFPQNYPRDCLGRSPPK